MRRKDREVTDIEKIKEILDACKVSRIGLWIRERYISCR